MSVRATVVWDPKFVAYDFGPGHPWQSRARAIAVSLLRRELRLSDGSGRARFVDEVPPARREQLSAFHEPEFLDLVERLDRHGEGAPFDRGDTPSFPGCFEAAARVVAGTLRALSEVWQGPGRSFQPAGGLHHAHRGAASGFCIFNDIAVSIVHALARPGIGRVAYVDIDAHHGDGVMDGFYDDGRVLDIDFHQDGRTLFPGTGFAEDTGHGDGAGLKVNLSLPPRSGDAVLLPLFDSVAPTMIEEFRPDLIVLQSGVDGHEGDPLAQLRYTDAAYLHVVDRLVRLADRICGGRLLVTGGGGYLAENVARVFARVGGRLADAEIPPAGETQLPAAWRGEFERTFERAAPPGWGTAEPAGRTPADRDRVDRILSTVGDALGRKFPSPGR